MTNLASGGAKQAVQRGSAFCAMPAALAAGYGIIGPAGVSLDRDGTMAWIKYIRLGMGHAAFACGDAAPRGKDSRSGWQVWILTLCTTAFPSP
jgi:hypothetical protein